MLKKLNILLITALLVVFAIPSFVSAHGTESSGDTAVTMHIEPNDKPVLGAKTQLEFFVNKDANGFESSNCDCKIRIKDESKQLSSQVLTLEDDALVGEVVFTEPTHYTVEFVATPTGDAYFEPIFASFPVHFDDSSGFTALDYAIYTGIPIAVVGVLLLLFIPNRH